MDGIWGHLGAWNIRRQQPETMLSPLGLGLVILQPGRRQAQVCKSPPHHQDVSQLLRSLAVSAELGIEAHLQLQDATSAPLF